MAQSFARRMNLPGVGVPFFAAFVAVTYSFNFVLVLLGPVGIAIELALIAWAVYDRAAFNGKGRGLVAFRRAWWWEAFREYFPITLSQEEPFDPKKRYLFAIHPHGIIGFSTWLSFAADCVGFSRKNGDLDLGLATVNINFYVPFWREILLSVGFVDASFKSLKAVLQRNRSAVVVVGGAAEALYARPGVYEIILNKRKGIIRLALATGTPLVPVFNFGESELFYQVANPEGSLLRRVQKLFLKVFKFSPPLPIGIGIFGCPVGIMPRRVPVHIVTGKPIPMPLIEKPSDEDVLKYQAIYRDALLKLYATHEKHYHENILPPELRHATRPELRIVE